MVFSNVLKRLGVLLHLGFFAASDLCKVVFLLTPAVVATLLPLLVVALLKAFLECLLDLRLALLHVLEHFNGEMTHNEEQLRVVLVLDVAL